MSASAAQQQQQQQQQPGSLVNATNQPPRTLRRAVYVHVSDLTGAYNIDHARLEEELSRVKQERENPPPEKTSSSRLGVPTELDTSPTSKRLQPPRGGFNLCVLVGKVLVVVDKFRVDGSKVRLAEVDVGDETGTVSLRARDDQIDVLKEVSERSGAVVLRNCTLELYQGKHIRLAVTKWGKLSTYPDQVASTPPPPSKMNLDRNFSLIDLSLVASEMVTDDFSQKSHSSDGHGGGTSNRHQGGGGGGGQSGGRHDRQSGQSYGRQGSGGGGNRGRRPSSSRGKPSSAPKPAAAPVHYQERSMGAPMRYQGGVPGYGGGYGEAQAYSYGMPQRQQEQMMMQQQFEIQQRQMQHPMYQTQPGERPSSLQSHSPMLAPGVPNAASFDTTFSAGSEIPMPLLGSNPFMMPIAGGQTSPQPGQLTPTQLMSSRSESPMTPGKMNPQAATFDPSKQNAK